MIKFELNYLEAMIVYVYMCICVCLCVQNNKTLTPLFNQGQVHSTGTTIINAMPSLSLSLLVLFSFLSFSFSNSFYLSFSLPFLGVFLSLFLFVGIFCFTFCYLSMVFYFPESLLIQLPLSLIR